MSEQNPSPPKPWLTVDNARKLIQLLGILWVALVQVSPTPKPPAPQPIDVVKPVVPTPAPEPANVPTVNYVVGPDGAVLEDGSVPHFSAVSKQPQGAYEFHKIQAKKPVSITSVVVGNGQPTPVPPGPTPPPQPPSPVVDDFAKTVKSAYVSDNDGNKLDKLNQLIAGYAACQSSIQSSAFATTGELYADIRKTVFSKAGSVSLQNTREAVGKELNSKLSDGGTLPLTPDVRTKVSEQFKRAQTALESCR